MDDRELLELAAKAAGIDWFAHGTMLGDSPCLRAANAPLGMWAPLTDDGDALRLAVKLGLELKFNDSEVVVFYSRPWRTTEPISNNLGPNLGRDPYAATRRAIVRAAAAIGEKR